MANDKSSEVDEERESTSKEFVAESSTRARNRTVMLTPEITGQVRARLAQDSTQTTPSFSLGSPAAGGNGDFESVARPTQSGEAGFARPTQIITPSNAPSSGGYAAPAASQRGAASHAAAHAPVEHKASGTVVWLKLSPVVGFLVSYDSNENGDVYDLRSGRLIVSSEPAAGNYMLVRHDTVSPMHAILRITSSGEIQVLDQLSEHGTKIKRYGSEEVEELSGEKGTVEHGDVLMFGERVFHVCLVMGN